MKYLFYCPKCYTEGIVSSLPSNTIPNIRDGYGMPIHHYPCPICKNKNSGFMRFRSEEDEYSISTIEYYKSVIQLYQ